MYVGIKRKKIFGRYFAFFDGVVHAVVESREAVVRL